MYSLAICCLFLIAVFADYATVFDFQKDKISIALRFIILGIVVIWSITNSIEIFVDAKMQGLKKALWLTISSAPILFIFGVLLYLSIF